MKRCYLNKVIRFFLPLLTLANVTPAWSTLLHEYIDTNEVKQLSISGGDLSDITYNWDSNTFFTIQNNIALVTEFNKTFSTPLRVFKLKGHNDNDYEAITYIGNNRFAIANESNYVFIVTISNGLPNGSVISTNPKDKNVQEYTLPAPHRRGKGIEGVCYSNEGPEGRMYAVQEDRKKKVYSWFLNSKIKNQTARSEGMFWWETSSSLKVDEPFDPERLFPRLLKDLSGCYFDNTTRSLYLLSHESTRLLEMTVSGQLISRLDIKGLQQPEGVTKDNQGHLYFVGEPYFLKIYKNPRAND